MKKMYLYKIMLVVIIAIQVVYISCLFGINKKGYHSDELWNYGFANSTQGMHVYTTDDGEKISDKWQNSEILRKYITVDKNEIFNYAAIYRNAANDYNPPLGYMMLHLICSIFPGTWSKWYCFFLNIICFIVMQIYVYKLGKSITKSEVAGLLSVFFFGFTAGARNITIFLRIYAPATMFAIMLLYYIHVLYDRRNSNEKCTKIYIGIFVVNILGCFTLNLFLPYAFIVTVMYSLFYFFSKHYKKFWTFGCTMLISTLISILMFPMRFAQVNGSAGTLTYLNKKLPTIWQNKIYWAYLTNDLFGVHNSIWKTMTFEYILIGLGIIIFITLPMCFVFRNEKWLKKGIGIIKATIKDICKRLKKIPYTFIAMIVTVIFVIFIAALRTSTYLMGTYTTRYIFIIYPVMAVFSVGVMYSVVKYIIRNRIFRYIVSILFCVIFSMMSCILSPEAYYFKHEEEGVTLSQMENDANVIIVTNELWLLTCYTCELYNTNSFYVASYESALQDDFELDKINSPIYVVLDVTYMDGNQNKMKIPGANVVELELTGQEKEYKSSDYINYIENNNETVSKIEMVGKDAVFGRNVNIYKISR